MGTEFYNTCVNVHTAGTYDDEYERANHDYCSDDLLAYQAQYFDGGRYCLDFASVDKTHKKVYNIFIDSTGPEWPAKVTPPTGKYTRAIAQE